MFAISQVNHDGARGWISASSHRPRSVRASSLPSSSTTHLTAMLASTTTLPIRVPPVAHLPQDVGRVARSRKGGGGPGGGGQFRYRILRALRTGPLLPSRVRRRRRCFRGWSGYRHLISLLCRR